MKTDPGESCWYEYERFENERNPVLEKARKEFEAANGSIEKAANRKAWRLKQKEAKRGAGGQKVPGYGPTDMSDEEHKDGRNVRRVTSWLDRKSYGDKPFFIACGIQKPHVPFWAPKKYFDLYPREKLVIPPALVGDWNDIPARAMVKRFKAFGFELDKENDPLRRAYTQAYHACISFIDAQIGLLLDALKRNKLRENTIVILISDHGYHLGEHYMWGKVSLFEECARVPMVIRVPGRTREGTSSNGLLELVDIYPTLSELCGLKAPAHLQGKSFTELLDDPSGAGRETAYTVVSRGTELGRSIRTARWRYAEWGSSSEAELYDLEKDPAEHTNLAGKSQSNDQLEKMRLLLEKARKRSS
jgi:iduronate 2-sulfatase